MLNFHNSLTFLGNCLFYLSLTLSLTTLSLTEVCSASNVEEQLRTDLLTNYNKYVRPINNYDEAINVTIGLAVQNIESFNQIQETIELNIWLRKYWTNDYLTWNDTQSPLLQLTLDNDQVWTPDIELLNAATIPDIYTLKGGMYLYNSGSMLWSMPAVYKFSCALQLEKFPFDTQDCSMKFGSWTYDNSLLSLKPHGSAATQIDVLDSFSHSEWKLLDYYVTTYNETRDCCGDKQFDINEYHFMLSRYSHYYKLNMGMTISLVIVSFIIMLIKPDNLSRTGTAVFIPLTILALQLTIADKIPVVGYYTLMDQFFLTCFITSMIVSIESGLVYTLITTKSRALYNMFEKIIDFDSVLKRERDEYLNSDRRQVNHANFIKERKNYLFPVLNRDFENEPSTQTNNTKSINVIETNLDDVLNLNSNWNSKTSNQDIDFGYKDSMNEISKSDFDLAQNILTNIHEDTESNTDSNTDTDSNEHKLYSNPLAKTESLTKRIIRGDSLSTLRRRTKKEINQINSEFNEFDEIVEKDIIKTISWDDENLSITYKEYVLFNEVSRIFVIVDNVFRVILPITFLAIMIYIYSFEHEN